MWQRRRGGVAACLAENYLPPPRPTPLRKNFLRAIKASSTLRNAGIATRDWTTRWALGIEIRSDSFTNSPGTSLSLKNPSNIERQRKDPVVQACYVSFIWPTVWIGMCTAQTTGQHPPVWRTRQTAEVAGKQTGAIRYICTSPGKQGEAGWREEGLRGDT